jgi:hypothetical protein
VTPANWFKGLLRSVFSREDLPTDAIASGRERRGVRATLRWLLQPEALPQDSLLPKAKKSYFSWFLQAESLPQDPAPPRKGKGFLGNVLGREPLPSDPEDLRRN